MDNFYNTKNISSKGRGGDTTIRTVKGESSHVNIFEAYLIDNHDKIGEEIVSEIGSGTINPNTGLREYKWEPWTSISDAWDKTLGKHGLGGWLGDYEGTLEERKQAGIALDLGMEGITESAKASFRPGGYFDKTKDLNVSQTLGAQFSASQTGQKLASQVGMASSGAANQVQSLQKNQVIQDAMVKSTQLSKDKADLALNLRNQVNQLLSTYGSATGEVYGNTEDLYAELDLSMGGTGG
jgi:hypothetical protein